MEITASTNQTLIYRARSIDGTYALTEHHGYINGKEDLDAFYMNLDGYKYSNIADNKMISLKKIASIISSARYDDLEPKIKEKMRSSLQQYFISIAKAKGLNIQTKNGAESLLLSFSKREIPYVFFLYVIAFIDINPSLDNDLTYNLDFIVSSRTADCGDVSLAAYNLFTKAGITARVVKAYITEDGADMKKYGKKIDAHVICIFKQGDNWGFIDEQSIIEPRYRDPQGIFCGYSVFKSYVIRARFVNEAKWNSIIRETKEPEDGPIAENIFYDNNFFYVQARDKCK